MYKTAVLLLAALFTTCLYGQEKVKIAVFETQGTASAAIREELKNALVDGLRNNSSISVLERSVLSQVMKEQGLQMSDSFDEGNAINAGKLAGAKYICTSSVNSANDFEYRIVYRLVDVETGETLTSERKKATQSTLYNLLDEIASSKLFTAGDDNSTSASVCGCEIAKEDLPDGARISAGWRLPTLAELKCMCANKDEIGSFHFGAYTSSNKEQGNRKGVKFQFCDEIFVNNNASIRLVRSTGKAQNEVEEVQPIDTKTPKHTAIKAEAAPKAQKSAPVYGTDESALRTGFEFGLEASAGYSFVYGNIPFGINLLANYRFTPQLAVGFGLGVPSFAHCEYNFNDAKLSPFVRVEFGTIPYTYEYYGYNSYESYSENSLYGGLTGGVCYSFNPHWALLAGIKATYAFSPEDFVGWLNVGVVYHL